MWQLLSFHLYNVALNYLLFYVLEGMFFVCQELQDWLALPDPATSTKADAGLVQG